MRDLSILPVYQTALSILNKEIRWVFSLSFSPVVGLSDKKKQQTKNNNNNINNKTIVIVKGMFFGKAGHFARSIPEITAPGGLGL